MKRIVCILSATALLTSSVALADPMTIDLDAMTPVEINEIIEMAEAEYKEATDFSSSDSRLLTENFETAFESLIPADAEASYPLFGLNKQRARSMYMLSGECTVRFADKSRSSYNMTMIYWHEEEARTFHQVAFYSNEKVYYCDNDLLKNVAPYLSESILQTLGADEVVYHATSAQATPVPTPTPEPTATPTPSPAPTPTATPVPTPTPTATPAPTALTPEAQIELTIREVFGDDYIKHEFNSITANCNIYFNLGSGWDNASVRSGFLGDCARILKKLDALNDSGEIYLNSIYLQADGEFYDKYGNATTEKAMALRIYKDTLDKISWDRFDYNDLVTISDSYWCHQALKD